MRNAKSVIAFILMVILYVSVTCLEYDLAMHFRILCSAASVSGLFVLLSALFRAPEGYEDATGFRIGALPKAALS